MIARLLHYLFHEEPRRPPVIKKHLHKWLKFVNEEIDPAGRAILTKTVYRCSDIECEAEKR